MIKDPGPEFRLLTAGTFKQAVINDEGIDTISIRKGFNSICNFSGQEGRKTKPVDPGIVQEPVEGIFRKRLTEGSGFLLHVHAAIRKDIAQLIFEDIQYRNAFFFLGITLAKQFTDSKRVEKRRNCVKEFLSVLILW